jgi:hypothetical protein
MNIRIYLVAWRNGVELRPYSRILGGEVARSQVLHYITCF